MAVQAGATAPGRSRDASHRSVGSVERVLVALSAIVLILGLGRPPGSRTSIGVHLNDGTGSKMDGHMRTGTAARWCADGTAGLRLTLRNGAPDPATLPGYVTGGGAYGVPVGRTLFGVYILVPPDARVESRQATENGAPSGFVGGDDRG